MTWLQPSLLIPNTLVLEGKEKKMGIYLSDHTAALLLDMQAKYSTYSFAYRKEKMKGNIIFARFYAYQWFVHKS